MLPLDTSVQAEYEDGFVIDETSQGDTSLFVTGHNTFYDILNKLPEAEHGQMVRFSVFWKNHRYDIDWRGLSENARPIRFRHGYHHWHPDGSEEHGWSGIDFGYQYTDKGGRNVQEVHKLHDVA
jgi:hypothetical protein